MFALQVQQKKFKLGEGATVEVVAKLIDSNTDPAWRSKTNGAVAEKLARLAMTVQDSRLDPTTMPIEEYRAQAATLTLSDVQRAAERLRELS